MSINCIRTLLEDANKTHPDKIAIVCDDQKMTYGELFLKVNQVSYFLTELNLDKGSRVGLYSNKRIEQVIAILAILSTEYILVPLTKMLKSEQLKYVVEDCVILNA